jgi:hypothetical protein
MSPRFARYLIIPTMALVMLAGCSASQEPPPATYPVRGKVLLSNGQPAYPASITFYAKDKPGNDAMALTGPDGSFALGTFSKDDGAIPGHYAVTIEPLALGTGSAKNLPRITIPKQYLSESNTPLNVEVKEGDNVLQPFQLR